MRSRPPSFGLVPGLAFLLVVLAGLGVWDLVSDAGREPLGMHGLIDIAFVLLAAGSAWVLGRGWLAAERSLVRLDQVLATHRSERDAWRSRAHSMLRGLGEALDRQFGEWQLTPAEKQTALMLLKGFSHKEIAALNERSERTVRQHAVAVYRKSGLSGRAELAAFFFEDMLLPAAEDETARTADAKAQPAPGATRAT